MKKPTLTRTEVEVMIVFCELYFALLSEEKGIGMDTLEYEELIKDNVDEVTDVVFNFKRIYYPDKEIDLDDFTDFETEFFISKFGAEKVMKIVDEIL